VNNNYEGIEQVVVYVDLGQVVKKLDEIQQPIQVQDLPEIIKAWELGGVTDPLGQLISWLWDQISKSFEWLNRQIWNYLMTFRDWILSGVSSFISSLQSWLSGVLASIQSGISSLFSSLQSFVSYVYSAFANVAAAVSAVAAQITSSIYSVFSSLMSAISSIGSLVQSAISAAQSFVANLINSISATVMQIWSMVSNLPNLLWQGIQQVWGWIQNIGQMLGNMLWQGVQTIMSVLQQVPQWIWQGIQQVIAFTQNIGQMLLQGIQSVATQIVSFFQQIPQLFWQGIQTLWSWIQSAFQTVAAAVAQIPQLVTSAVQSVASMIQQGFQWVAGQIHGAIAGFIEGFRQAFTQLSQVITDVFNRIAGGLNFVYTTIQGFINAILKFPEWFPNWFQQFIATPIANAITQVGNWIQQIANAIAKVPEVIVNIPQYISQAVQQVAQQIWQMLPEDVKKFFEAARKFFEDVYKFFTETLPTVFEKILAAIEEFSKDPAAFISKYVIEPLSKVIDKLFDAILGGLDELIKSKLTQLGIQVQGILHEAVALLVYMFYTSGINWQLLLTKTADFIDKRLLATARSIIGTIATLTTAFAVGAYQMLYNAVQQPISQAVNILLVPISNLFTKMFEVITTKFKELIEGKIDIAGYVKEFFTAIIPITVSITAVTELLHATGVEINRVSGLLMPMAIGAVIGALGGGAEGEYVCAVARTLHEGAWRIIQELPFGFALWFAESLRKPIEFAMRYKWRNEIPIEIPTVSEGKEIVRRWMPSDKFDEMLNKYREWLALRGFSDFIIDLVTKKVEQASIVVKDRFDKDRHFPLALMYDIPTASELCRMMVRDMFKGLDDFAKAMQMRGYVKDLAYMFYLLHFRYPSPEKLWQFTTRGIAGLLWFKPTDEMKQDAQTEAQKIGAFVPKAPIELNFQHSKLLSAFTTYMKWHDMARFAWINDYTCDNWLYIDVLADIPTKIDVRWMTKWGIFELMSQKNIGLKTPVSEFTKVLEPGAANPKVTMDLVLMCRLLQATGLHPYYVPITAVAEAINALADERTLLRTGFINLFKEGFFNLKTVEELLSGLVKASFKVAYFDLTKMDWDTKWINIPVMFLPAERKLLELRALMDRALDLLRDYVYELRRAAAENVINPKEFAKYLNDFVLKLNNDWFVPEIKEISGVEKGLVVDEAYYKFYQEIVEQYYRIYTVRRIRSWLGWLLRNLMYRIERGYVTKGEVKKLIDELKATARLTDEETKVMEDVANFMASLFVRETRARAILRRVARGVLEPEKAVEELTKLGLDKEEAEALVEAYGKIYTLSIERMISMMEYIPVPEDMFNKKIKMMGVPEDEAKLLKPYALARVLSSEVGRYITELITDYARGVITRDEFLRELDDVQKLWGVAEKFRLPWMILSPEEKEVLIKLADARRKRYEARYRRR